MEPFSHLLSTGTPFEWTRDLEEKFQEGKKNILKAVENGVESFSTDRKTILAVDWSKNGVGTGSLYTIHIRIAKLSENGITIN